jgi:Cu(I)/Ag(I) efflux system membrane fusion protein
MGRTVAVLGVIALLAFSYWLGARTSDKNIDSEMKAQNSDEKKILFYRNPMGLPDTSDVPKQDSMGMDYIPVYREENEALASGSSVIKISVEKIQKLGVKTELASMRQLDHSLRAVGRVELNERQIYTIAPKFEGWIDALHVNAMGEQIKSGQALFEVYSPELISAQREYLIAAQGLKSMQDAVPEAKKSMEELAQASLLRLKSWDISDEDLNRLRKTGEVKRTIPYRSTVQGIVLEKTALEGMRFMPGEALFKIADLSRVWIIADISEQESGLVRVGQAVQVSLEAYPGQVFNSRVTYVYPTLNPLTRTTPVRLEINNKDGLLRPGMFAQLAIQGVGSKGRVITVPDSAVIYSGRREIVLVALSEGRYEAREVKLGVHTDEYVEVKEGVAAGENVVVSANFLIDAESNLKAVIAGFGQPEKNEAGNSMPILPGAP